MKQILNFIRKQPRWRLITAGLLVVVGLVWLFSGNKTAPSELTFIARSGDLPITVLEGGSIEALESQEIRSEVKGATGTKILKIVEEGYQVTEQDVKNGKILVELDSADLRDKLVQGEIQFQSALATLTDATQNYEIQRNQNISNIKAAEQKAQFARMDFEKYMSDKSAEEIVKALNLDKMQEAVDKLASAEDAEQSMLSALENSELAATENGTTNSAPADAPAKVEVVKASLTRPLTQVKIAAPVDFASYAKPEALGDGAAMQNLRKLTDDLQTYQQQFGVADTKLAGTQRLFEKGFATKTELETDQISYTNCALRVKTAQTAYNLFIRYEFPRQAQEYASKYEEALRGLEREKKEAISKLAQARARLKGAESHYRIEADQRKNLLEQMDKCTIKAQRPGLVVYGGNSSDYYGNQEQIREGATVRERQPIITIPDMSKMAVRVKVHESYIQKISKGLKAKIRVDAYANQELTGEVSKVGLLPDSQNRWFNPDMKVYQTMVTIDGSHAWLKPGMSAKVELLVKQLKNVVYVPLQAVNELNNKQYVQVIDGTKSERRMVEVGDFNDEFIEIKSGLNAGEKVSLHAPEADANEAQESGVSDSDKPAASKSAKSGAQKGAAPKKKLDKLLEKPAAGPKPK